MIGFNALVRQAMLAALLLWPALASAEVRATLDQSTGAVHILGLDPTQRQELIEDSQAVFLQHSALESDHSMALSVVENDEEIVIHPRFRLQPGADYVLRIELEGTSEFEAIVSVQGSDMGRPELLWHAPNAGVIPENTLRLYLMFSEPMAKGQVRDAIRVERPDGTVVHSPFLNLGAELWDPEQRRLTLLFDPGRIKQGVGPNHTNGAPLQSRQSYVLVVSRSLKSAAGEHIGEEMRLPLRVGPAERRALDPSAWKIRAPKIRASEPLHVRFDRLVDHGASARLLTVLDGSGKSVPGRVESDGINWFFTPNEPWTGTECLRIDPGLEDVAGNTIRAPFDADPGTIGKETEAVTLAIY